MSITQFRRTSDDLIATVVIRTDDAIVEITDNSGTLLYRDVPAFAEPDYPQDAAADVFALFDEWRGEPAGPYGHNGSPLRELPRLRLVA